MSVRIQSSVFLIVAAVFGSTTVPTSAQQKKKSNPSNPPSLPAGIITQADPRAIHRYPKPIPGAPWSDRVGSTLGQADELGPLVPGKFAMIVQDGNAFYAPLGEVKAPPQPSGLFGFAETKRAVAKEEEQLLDRGITANAMVPWVAPPPRSACAVWAWVRVSPL